jgi:hypothetical protein
LPPRKRASRRSTVHRFAGCADEHRPELSWFAPILASKSSDLRDRKVAVGLKNNGMTQHAEAVFAALGIASDDLSESMSTSPGRRHAAAGEVDAQFQCPIPNRVMSDLAERVRGARPLYDPPHLDAALRPSRAIVRS